MGTSSLNLESLNNSRIPDKIFGTRYKYAVKLDNTRKIGIYFSVFVTDIDKF